MLVAVHVAGKAVRDTLFLSSFEVTDLPKMMIAGSAASLLAAIAVSRFLSRFSPARTVPLTVSLSAGLLFGFSPAALMPLIFRPVACSMPTIRSAQNAPSMKISPAIPKSVSLMLP